MSKGEYYPRHKGDIDALKQREELLRWRALDREKQMASDRAVQVLAAKQQVRAMEKILELVRRPIPGTIEELEKYFHVLAAAEQDPSITPELQQRVSDLKHQVNRVVDHYADNVHWRGKARADALLAQHARLAEYGKTSGITADHIQTGHITAERITAVQGTELSQKPLQSLFANVEPSQSHVPTPDPKPRWWNDPLGVDYEERAKAGQTFAQSTADWVVLHRPDGSIVRMSRQQFEKNQQADERYKYEQQRLSNLARYKQEQNDRGVIITPNPKARKFVPPAVAEPGPDPQGGYTVTRSGIGWRVQVSYGTATRGPWWRLVKEWAHFKGSAELLKLVERFEPTTETFRAGISEQQELRNEEMADWDESFRAAGGAA